MPTKKRVAPPPKPKPKTDKKPQTAQRNRTRRQVKRRRRQPKRNNSGLSGLPYSMRHLSVQYMDPDGKVDPPRSATSLGNFTTVNGVYRSTGFVTNPILDTFCLVQWTASDMACFIWNSNGGGAGDSPLSVQRIPQFSADALQMKPLRMSVTLRNVTQMVNVAGLVRVLNMPQNYDWSAAFGAGTSLNVATVNSIMNLIDSSSNTHSMTLQEITVGKTWVSYPISSVGYNAWYKQVNADTAQSRLVESSTNETMSTIFIHFPPTTTGAQQIEVVVRRQDGFRYAANTALSQASRPAPRGPLGEMETIARSISELNSAPIEHTQVGMTRETAMTRANTLLGGAMNVASVLGTAYRVGQAVATVL